MVKQEGYFILTKRIRSTRWALLSNLLQVSYTGTDKYVGNKWVHAVQFVE